MWHPSASRTCTQLNSIFSFRRMGVLSTAAAILGKNSRLSELKSSFFSSKNVSYILSSFLRFSN